MTNSEIYQVFLDHKTARTKAGFSMPISRAYEDAAYECDLSVKDVVVAVHLAEAELKALAEIETWLEPK